MPSRWRSRRSAGVYGFRFRGHGSTAAPRRAFCRRRWPMGLDPRTISRRRFSSISTKLAMTGRGPIGRTASLKCETSSSPGGRAIIGSHACKVLASASYTPVTYDNLGTGWRDAVRFAPFEQGTFSTERASTGIRRLAPERGHAFRGAQPRRRQHAGPGADLIILYYYNIFMFLARKWSCGSLNLLGSGGGGRVPQCRLLVDLRDLRRP